MLVVAEAVSDLESMMLWTSALARAYEKSFEKTLTGFDETIVASAPQYIKAISLYSILARKSIPAIGC